MLYHLGIPRGIYRDVFRGLLQRCLQLIPFYHFSLEYRSVFGRYFRSLAEFNFLGIFLKYLEDTSEEDCDADCVYMVLQNQRWGEKFENRWAVF